jgi:N-acetylglucosamine kinase-like BadF-type ATPase
MAVDALGAILYQGQSGAANLATTPEARLRRNLQQASKGCPQPAFVCGCFAGLINDDIRAKGLSHLRELFPAARLRAEPDYTAAFYASPSETDICVISGTGSLVCSREDGKIVKSGGRGYILGDEGSSFQFGRDAVSHFTRNPGNASPILASAILEQFETCDASEVITAVHRTDTPANLLARFAKVLGQDAIAKEPYAIASLNRHLSELAAVVEDHFKTHLPERRKSLAISLTGGLWKSSPIFKETFEALLRQVLPVNSLTVTRISKPPLYGAVELAREMFVED